MKTFNKTLIAAALLATTGAAQAELSANVGLASSYLWRGYDLSGTGAAVVSGGLDYAEGPFYAGVWASSGDTSYGTEYDLYAGLAGEMEGFSYDVGYVTYNYPDGGGINDFEEFYLSLGFGGFGVAGYFNTDSGFNDTYYALSYGYEDFGFTYGMWGDEGSHIDASYTLSDVTLTLSQSMDDSVFSAGYSEELQVVVSYSLPLEM